MVVTSAVMAVAGRREPASMSPVRCSRPPGYISAVWPRIAASNMRRWPSAFRAMWVATWPTVQSGSSDGCTTCWSVKVCKVATTARCARAAPARSRSRSFMEFSPYTPRERGNLAGMQIAMVGLGRMGANMVRRLQRAGHECVAYDLNPAAVQASEADGARGADTPQAVVDALDAAAPHLDDGSGCVRRRHRRGVRAAAVTRRHPDRRRQQLVPRRRRPRRSARRAGHQLHRRRHQRRRVRARSRLLLDGRRPRRSGGGDGARSSTDSHRVPARSSVRPVVQRRSRAGRVRLAALRSERCRPLRQDGPQRDRVRHDGGSRRGPEHLAKADVGAVRRPKDAETAPLTHPEYYQYDFDLAAITELWRRGSVISSWLLDLAAAALARIQHSKGFEGSVSDSGEGRWTMHAAIDEGVPVPVLSAALYQRFSSRGRATTPTRSCRHCAPSSVVMSKEQGTQNE